MSESATDNLLRIRGERGFIPLLPQTLEKYRHFWPNHVANLSATVTPWQGEYNAWPEARVYNGWFECGDAELYYSMIRTLRPNLIIEVGSGFCTRFAVDACIKNGKGRMICIDPNPRTDLPDFVRFERQFVQEIDLAIFEQLQEKDILFIDTSHEAEETLYHYQILDRIAPGVMVHHHDFAFPNLPEWPEENVIISYYMNHPGEWEGFTNNALARDELGAERYAALFPHYRHAPYRFPGSIYTRRRFLSERERHYQELREEYTRTADYARHVVTEYGRAMERVRVLDEVVNRPSLAARALLKGIKGVVRRRDRS